MRLFWFLNGEEHPGKEVKKRMQLEGAREVVAQEQYLFPWVRRPPGDRAQIPPAKRWRAVRGHQKRAAQRRRGIRPRKLLQAERQK